MVNELIKKTFESLNKLPSIATYSVEHDGKELFTHEIVNGHFIKEGEGYESKIRNDFKNTFYI